MTNVRILPLTVAGVGLLLALKVLGLAVNGGYALAVPPPAVPKVALQDETYRPVIAATVPGASAPPSSGSSLEEKDVLVTGSTGNDQGSAAKSNEGGQGEAAKSGENGGHGGGEASKPFVPARVSGIPLPTDPKGEPVSEAERALLQRLQKRREELEARAHELEMREALLQAAEQRLDERVGELKALEARFQSVDQGQKAKEEDKLKDLVTMYENMKPKEAARIFDQLNLKVLVGVVTQMNPRKASEIMAKMTPEAAQKLTVALAAQSEKNTSASLDALPKIEGRPQ